MKNILVMLSLALSANAYAHGVSPSEVYTIVTTAITVSPTIATANMSEQKRKVLTGIEEYSQSGELSVELQAMVGNLQELDKTLSVEEALDLIIDATEKM